MTDIRNALVTFLESLKSVVALIQPLDFLDMLVVAFLVYQTIRLVRETRAMQLVKGIGVVLIAYLIANNLDLITLKFIITTVLQWGIVALAIVFQPELRRALEQVGRSRLAIGGFRRGDRETQQRAARTLALIDSVCEAAQELSKTRTGALMVLENITKLGDVITTGTVIDSAPSTQLICNIFFHNAPLHDGAMVTRDGRLYAAGCFLPLSQNDQLGRELGTRHRAALGMSEVSDAVVVVVSEETGIISAAADSRLERGLTPAALREQLSARLLPADILPAKRASRRKSE